jgi:hypothetical protein
VLEEVGWGTKLVDDGKIQGEINLLTIKPRGLQHYNAIISGAFVIIIFYLVMEHVMWDF